MILQVPKDKKNKCRGVAVVIRHLNNISASHADGSHKFPSKGQQRLLKSLSAVDQLTKAPSLPLGSLTLQLLPWETTYSSRERRIWSIVIFHFSLLKAIHTSSLCIIHLPWDTFIIENAVAWWSDRCGRMCGRDGASTGEAVTVGNLEGDEGNRN